MQTRGMPLEGQRFSDDTKDNGGASLWSILKTPLIRLRKDEYAELNPASLVIGLSSGINLPINQDKLGNQRELNEGVLMSAIKVDA